MLALVLVASCAHCNPGRACRVRRSGTRSDGHSKADRGEPRKPSAYLGKSCSSSVAHRDKTVPILFADSKLFDRALFGRCRVRRVNEADKSRWRSPQPADLPSRDAALLSLTTLALTLTHASYIGQRSGESESPATRTAAV
jgi:hypothetical protein